MFTASATQVQQLITILTQLAVLGSPPALASSIPAPSLLRPISEPRVRTPKHYVGDPEGCNQFLENFSILFALQTHTLSSEEAKVAFTISHLMGRAWQVGEMHACL